MSKRTIGADGLDELPGNEVEDAPVWHAIVGDGWEPVQFREIAQPDEEVLLASGWINASPYGGGFVYGPEHKPRRRRKRRYDVLTMKDGINFCRVKAAKPGDCFMLSQNGELIPVDKPPTQSTE